MPRSFSKNLLPLYLLLAAFLLHNIEAGTFRILSQPKQCITRGFYDCSKCPCNYTSSDLIPTVFISTVLMIVGLVQLFFFACIPGLRRKPGDILAALAFADVLYACGKIIGASTYTTMSTIDDSSNSMCLASGLIYTVSNGMITVYHIVYFAYYLGVLRFSLKGSIPGWVYHLGCFTLVGIFLFGSYEAGSSGRSVYGVCEIKTAPGIWIPLVSNLGFLFVVYMFAYFTRKYIPQNEKTKELRASFIDYYNRYILVISIIYIMKLISGVVHGLIMNNVANGTATTTALVCLNITKVLADILNCGSPLLQAIMRINDPIVKSNWTKIYALYTKFIPTRMTALTLNEALVADKAQQDIELKDPTEGHVSQFQQSRRIQVLYSVLAGIHYFWHVKEMNKLIELDQINISEDASQEDINSVVKESKNMRTLLVQKDTLTKQVPELFKQIEEQRYSLERGTLIAYAPRLFEEIILLDDIGRGIRKSLDLTDNFNRILKSGVNGGGKSGEFFFFSDDNKFIVKTISDAELEIFREILPQYSRFLKANPKSLITKMYGVFTFKVSQPSERYNLILMGNINGFPSDCVERKYDLKGSTVGRIAIKEDTVSIASLKDKGVLKDLDFDRFEQQIHLDPEEKKELYEILRKDVGLLSSLGLVDYSLALYVINRKKKPGYVEEDGIALRTQSVDSKIRASHTFKSVKEDVWYHIGIIDYLVAYNFKKQSEVFFKKLGAMDPNLDISVQRPEYYGERFTKYMEKILSEETHETHETPETTHK